jgi:hypothetical protein
LTHNENAEQSKASTTTENIQGRFFVQPEAGGLEHLVLNIVEQANSTACKVNLKVEGLSARRYHSPLDGLAESGRFPGSSLQKPQLCLSTAYSGGKEYGVV